MIRLVNCGYGLMAAIALADGPGKADKLGKINSSVVCFRDQPHS